MKARCARLLPELVKATKEAREREAAEVMGIETVRVAIHQAAEKGHTAWRIRLPDWFDAASNTPAARALMDWTKTEGLRLDWESRETTLSDGRRVTVWEPEISWAQPNAATPQH